MYFGMNAHLLARPEARLFPYSILDTDVRELSNSDIELMTAPWETVRARLAELKIHTGYNEHTGASKQIRYWYCIAFGHPTLSADQLAFMANELSIPFDVQLLTSAHLGHMDFFNRFTPEEITTNETAYTKSFIAAAESGHLSIVDRLIGLLGTEITKTIGTLYMLPNILALAAGNGHLHIINRLAELAQNEILTRIKADRFKAFCDAANHGHLAVINRLIELAPTEVQNMVKVNDYLAFRLAAYNGHLPVIDKLIELAPGEVLNMIKQNDYEAFRSAAGNGHLSVINRLVAEAPSELANMIKTKNYCAFIQAAGEGHLDVINRLVELAPGELLNMIKASGYFAFRLAAQNGHLDVINRLIEWAPDELAKMIEKNGYNAFRDASANGHLDVINKLIELAPGEVSNMISVSDGRYDAFRFAAKHGQLAVVNRLLALTPENVPEMIESFDYEAFREAAKNGHLDIINRLIEVATPAEVSAMIKSSSCGAFLFAAQNGHLAVVNRLIEASADAAPDMIAYAAQAFALAAENNHFHVVNRLFSFYRVTVHALMHEEEYGHITHPYITSTLASLRNQKQAFEAANPHAVFDLTDENEIKRCYFILFSLIRRNDAALLDDIRFLLDIPALKALAHEVVDGSEPNLLVRQALLGGNAAAAQLLLTIPAVNTLAATYDYYRDEIQGGIDIAVLTRDRESSMHSLTVGEQQRLSAAISRYQPVMQEGGEPLFVHLLDTLKERYAGTPAKITKDDGSELALPLEWSAFTALTLNEAERQRALKAYYQQKDHTALRYLSQPNHWMNPDASYVYINDEHTERWSTFAEYKPLIVMLWLAAKDTTIPPTDGHTLETRIEHFIDELAHIARAHNWDRNRPRADGHGTEEFDDLTGDKPSCFSGVKRRLFQSVVGHPMLKILTADDVKQEISAFIRDKFSSRITAENRAVLLAVWTKLIALDTDDAEPLKVLNITTAERAEFTDYMNRKYGAQYTNELAFTNFMARLCPEGGIDAQACDGLFDMLKLLESPAIAPAAASPHGFFSPLANAGAGAGVGINPTTLGN